MKRFVGLTVILAFFIMIPLSVYGTTNLENIDIMAEYNGFYDYFLVLEFGNYEYTRTGNPIPIVESAFLDINGDVLELDNLRVKIMGGSFVIHSADILIYAHGLGDNQYEMNTYLLTDNKFNGINLKTTGLVPSVQEIIIPQITTLIEHDTRTFWKQNYDIAVRVFDEEINENPEFHESFGGVENADIVITITDEEGLELSTLNGKTDDKGIWEGEVYIVENLTHSEKYFVDVNVSYLGAEDNQTLETFVIADTEDSESISVPST